MRTMATSMTMIPVTIAFWAVNPATIMGVGETITVGDGDAWEASIAVGLTLDVG